jgi:hypothetical protein
MNFGYKFSNYLNNYTLFIIVLVIFIFINYLLTQLTYINIALEYDFYIETINYLFLRAILK